MHAKRSVRLSDVATLAGVSLSTASRALSGSPRISKATTDRVREVADRLDFRPNLLAKSFASGQSATIGVLTQRASSTFARSVLIGAVVELGQRKHAALVLDGDHRLHPRMAASVRQLQDRRIDGLLVIGDAHDHRIPSLTHEFDVPVTYAFGASDVAEDTVFLPDSVMMGVMATQRLVDIGRTKIAHITGPAHSMAAQRREEGMREVLRAGGLELVGEPLRGSWLRSWGVRAATELLDAGAEVDAIFCGSDHIAFGVIDVCEARGIRIPDDIALVGIDNWEGTVVDQDSRQLTTVDPELMELGHLAARDLLAPERAGGEHFCRPTLVLGQSA